MPSEAKQSLAFASHKWRLRDTESVAITPSTKYSASASQWRNGFWLHWHNSQSLSERQNGKDGSCIAVDQSPYPRSIVVYPPAKAGTKQLRFTATAPGKACGPPGANRTCHWPVGKLTWINEFGGLQDYPGLRCHFPNTKLLPLIGVIWNLLFCRFCRPPRT